MPVLHDYECKAHGVFEAMAAKCPHGCSKSFVQRVFLKAPGFKSDRTSRADRTIRDLAAAHGMTNLGNRGGESVSKYLGGAAASRSKGGSTQFQQTESGSAWMKLDHTKVNGEPPKFDTRALGSDGQGFDVPGMMKAANIKPLPAATGERVRGATYGNP